MATCANLSGPERLKLAKEVQLKWEDVAMHLNIHDKVTASLAAPFTPSQAARNMVGIMVNNAVPRANVREALQEYVAAALENPSIAQMFPVADAASAGTAALPPVPAPASTASVPAPNDAVATSSPSAAAAAASAATSSTPSKSLLLFATDVASQRRIRVQEELNAIEEKIRGGSNRDEIHLHRTVLMTDFGNFMTNVRKCNPTVVHISAHGTEKSLFVHSSNQKQGSIAVEGDKVASFLALMKSTVRLVFLSACLSDDIAEKIAKGIDGCAIGMSGEVSDDVAIAFSKMFYARLADGFSVEVAFTDAKYIVEVDCKFDKTKLAPQLKCAAGVDASKLIPFPSICFPQGVRI